MADLVKGITALDPKVLAVDIFFSEHESPEADKALGDALFTAKDKVVLALPFEVWVGKKNREAKNIPDAIIDSAFLKVQESNNMFPVEADTILPTVPEILRNSLSGHVYSHSDYDGKYRWAILYLKYGDEFFPSLALQAARISLGLGPDKMAIAGDRGVALGDNVFIPSDRRGRALINYLGKEGTFKYISAAVY